MIAGKTTGAVRPGGGDATNPTDAGSEGPGRRETRTGPSLGRSTSIYLDALRIFAAVGVFLGHADFPWFSGALRLVPAWGHEMVIVFFVLSGFVIAEATLGRPRGWRDYATARLSRLGSVVLPAVALTAILFRVGTALAPEFYAGFDRGHEGMREILAACFCGELWFSSSTPPSNGPLWSLGYEFWYYVLFGCWIYARSARWRWTLGALALLASGPKIALLLPVWLLGVLGWKGRERSRRMPGALAQAGLAASGLGAAGLIWSGWTFPGGQLALAPWFHAGRWVSDGLLGVLVLAHIACFEPALRGWRVPDGIERITRFGAGVTFSLYAYHFPLLVFCAAAIPYRKDAPAQVFAVLGAVLVIIYLFHLATERQRPHLRRRLDLIMAKRKFQGGPVAGETR